MNISLERHKWIYIFFPVNFIEHNQAKQSKAIGQNPKNTENVAQYKSHILY